MKIPTTRIANCASSAARAIPAVAKSRAVSSRLAARQDAASEEEAQEIMQACSGVEMVVVSFRDPGSRGATAKPAAQSPRARPAGARAAPAERPRRTGGENPPIPLRRQYEGGPTHP